RRGGTRKGKELPAAPRLAARSLVFGVVRGLRACLPVRRRAAAPRTARRGAARARPRLRCRGVFFGGQALLLEQLDAARQHVVAHLRPVGLVVGELLEHLALLFLHVVLHVLAQHLEGGGVLLVLDL